MDPIRFDALTRSLISARSRRAAVAALPGGILGLLGLLETEGKNKKNKKKKKGCRPRCSGGTLCCGETCTDLINDRFNCGTCGNACTEVEACVNGACKECPSPQTRCSPGSATTYCADLSSDRQNCGACGRACGENEVCKTGAGGGGVACICEGMTCPRPDGTSRCCPEVGGICCADGKCCPAGYGCAPDTGCCANGWFSCGNGRCCPAGYTCAGAKCLPPGP